MIQIHDGYIELHTKNTSYLLGTARGGLLETLHYGGRIRVEDVAPLLMKADAGYGMEARRTPDEASLQSLCLELSPVNKGDFRRGALLAEMPHGGQTADYAFVSAKTTKEPAPAGGMPQGHGGDETLVVSLRDPSGVEVEAFYTVFYDSDVITKKLRVTNGAATPMRLLRALSNQLDLPFADYTMYSLPGSWSREFDLVKTKPVPGLVRIGSGTGASGSKYNPFFFLAQAGAGEDSGNVYGFNLVYSGSHEASVEVDTHGKTRILQGIWSDGFSWPLAPGESFVTPEAVLTFSDEGMTGMSHNMHRFVKRHIVPARWQNVPRPVLLNNWEGTYFDFDEDKLVAMAKAGAKMGVELFVLDDGWFGRRDSPTRGLGDYDVNPAKLPSGLAGLADKINALGLDFGLWFEPEMISEDSRLYEEHPDWAIHTPGHTPAQGRNQLVLDLCRPEVRAYIIRSVSTVLDSANISYVKWDMNRHITDQFSPALADQGSYFHRYILGLYEILEAICKARPDILFEGCSGGGNRSDLGILSYMPQIWISDDTDAHERQRIQTGASFGYPLSIMGAHVSDVPNHQTLRTTPLETRFNTAIFGLLGYELDPLRLSREEKAEVSAQIAFYKEHRQVLQFGDFYRITNPFFEDGCTWIAVAPDGSKALAGSYTNLLHPNSAVPPLRLKGLDAAGLYDMAVRRQKVTADQVGHLIAGALPGPLQGDGLLARAAEKLVQIDTEDEHYTAYGNLLCKAGVRLLQTFSGACDLSDKMRIIQDFASRVYILTRRETDSAE